ncbi:MAG: protein-L-isoaspartate(D-aspartate) O-methyltransferase [Tenuifilaceae bacterium]
MRTLTTILILLCTLFSCAQKKENFEQKRINMVNIQIISRGITDQNTINALKKVPRHLFVPETITELAYNDSPLPIGNDQTISQPYIVALMTELSIPRKDKKVLEIGTGSGYQAAVLAEIVDRVYTIEIVQNLAEIAKERLLKLGYNNIDVKYGDGYKGWPEFAPFDIIIITAASNHIPQPLIDQLNENGRLIMPRGEPSDVQDLILLEKKNGKVTEKIITQVRFVPFTRKY